MIVYYSNALNAQIFEPEPLYNTVFKDYKSSEEIHAIKKCPSFIQYCKNTFVMKNIVDFEIQRSGNRYMSSSRGKEFFDNWMTIRSPEYGLCGYTFPYYTFLAEDSLEMELLPPFYHDTDLVKKSNMVVGCYDIGKHFRPLETAFQFKNVNDTIKFNYSEPLFYVRFKTNEKIKFKKFFLTNELKEIWNVLSLRDIKNIRPLEFWYDLFNSSNRKRVLKLIKQNLI
jgi:hypothetical protein